MYKLLVLDMDGTLLNKNKQISKTNKAAIKYAIKKGVKVAICTGRFIEGVLPYLEELDIINDDTYCITSSGAVVQNATQTQTFECNSLGLEDLNYVNNLCHNFNLFYNIFSDSVLLSVMDSAFNCIDSIANNVPLKIVNYEDITKDTLMTKFTLINEDKSIEKEMKSLFPNIDVDTNKFVLNPNFNKDLFSDLSNLPKELFEKYTVLKTSPFTIEVLHKKSSKGEGVKILSEKLNIERKDIICIGDSGNDHHMIEYAGLGVAMGNAFPEIKEIADYITLTNDENGVAHVINKFI